MPEFLVLDFQTTLASAVNSTDGPGATFTVATAPPAKYNGQVVRWRLGPQTGASEFLTASVANPATTTLTIVSREVEEPTRFPKATWAIGTEVNAVPTPDGLAAAIPGLLSAVPNMGTGTPFLLQNYGTTPNPTDTNDGDLWLYGGVAVNSAVNQSIYRLHRMTLLNILTGGGVVDIMRAIDLTLYAQAGSSTTTFDSFCISSGGGPGAVYIGRGPVVASLPGTDRLGFSTVAGWDSGSTRSVAYGVDLGNLDSLPAGTHWSIYSAGAETSYHAGKVYLSSNAPTKDARLAITRGEAVGNVLGVYNYSKYTGTPSVTDYNYLSEVDYRGNIPLNPYLPVNLNHAVSSAYGYQGGTAADPAVAASGTIISSWTGLVVTNCSIHESEHSPSFMGFRYDNNNNGFGNSTPGRMWGTDWNFYGCIGTQQSALGGQTINMVNHYNGPPRDADSYASVVTTAPFIGGSRTMYSSWSPSYQIGFGYGVKGFTDGGLSRGFETGFSAGGSGSNWQQLWSHLGNGVEAQDYDNAGIAIRSRFSGIMQLYLKAGGSGYTAAPIAAITGGGGTGANSVTYLVATTMSRTASTNKASAAGSGYAANQKVRVTYSDPFPWGCPAVGYLQASAGGLVNVNDNVLFASTLGTANVTFAGGKITAIALTGGGAGYPPNETALPLCIAQGSVRTAWCTGVTDSSGVLTAVTILGQLGTGYGTGGGYTAGTNTANLENTGTGYTYTPSAAVAASPTGNTAAVSPVLQATTVSHLRPNDLGEDYTSQPTITFSGGGGGSGAAAIATVRTMNCLTEAKVATSGSMYPTQPTPTVTVGTSNATSGLTTAGTTTLTTTVSGGKIATVALNVAGTGYAAVAQDIPVRLLGNVSTTNRSATAVLTVNASGVPTAITLVDGGSGYAAGDTACVLVSSVVIDAIVQNGNVVGTTVKDAGAGFVQAPTLAIGAPAGVQAAATANLTADAITSFTVTANGSGYWQGTPTVQLWVTGATAGTTGGLTVGTAPAPTATVTGGVITALGGTATGGTGYKASSTFTARLVGQTSNASNATVSLTTNSSGVITAAVLVQGGSGYTSGETLRYVGLASAGAVLYNGMVFGLTVGYGGAGYVAAPSVVISAPPVGASATLKPFTRFGGFAAVIEVGAGPIYQESGDPAAPNVALNVIFPIALAADFVHSTAVTTNVNVTGAAFTVGPNESWQFDMTFPVTPTSTGGHKYAVTFPAGATMGTEVFGSTTGITAFTAERITASGTLNATALAQTAVAHYVRITGTVRTGATAGTVQLQVAKVTAATNLTIARDGFVGIARRAA